MPSGQSRSEDINSFAMVPYSAESTIRGNTLSSAYGTAQIITYDTCNGESETNTWRCVDVIDGREKPSRAKLDDPFSSHVPGISFKIHEKIGDKILRSSLKESALSALTDMKRKGVKMTEKPHFDNQDPIQRGAEVDWEIDHISKLVKRQIGSRGMLESGSLYSDGGYVGEREYVFDFVRSSKDEASTIITTKELDGIVSHATHGDMTAQQIGLRLDPEVNLDEKEVLQNYWYLASDGGERKVASLTFTDPPDTKAEYPIVALSLYVLPEGWMSVINVSEEERSWFPSGDSSRTIIQSSSRNGNDTGGNSRRRDNIGRISRSRRIGY